MLPNNTLKPDNVYRLLPFANCSTPHVMFPRNGISYADDGDNDDDLNLIIIVVSGLDAPADVKVHVVPKGCTILQKIS